MKLKFKIEKKKNETQLQETPESEMQIIRRPEMTCVTILSLCVY